MVRVYVDERERTSGIPNILKAMGLTVIFKILSIADYVISENIAIERKRIDDFVSSVFDGRLFDQARRLCKAYDKPIFIVEGDLNYVKRITTKWSSILGALISLALDFNLPIIFTSDTRETAEVIKYIALREQKTSKTGKKTTIIAVSKKPRLTETHEWQEYIVQSLPYIGPKLAKRLLEYFGSVHKIFNASVSELAKVEGLGEKRAAEIVRIIKAQYMPHPGSKRLRKLTSFFEEK